MTSFKSLTLSSPRTAKREGAARARRGFSLLELLLAMAMAAMLALSLYTAMNVALRAKRSAQASLEPARAAMIAMDLILQDFESVPPPAGLNTLRGTFYATHQAAALGDNDTIEFYSIGSDPIEGDPADAPPLSEGVRKIELYVDETTGVPALVRRVTRNLLAATEAHAEEEILCNNVRSFSLRYFDGMAWQEEWDSTTRENALPAAVAVTLELGGADPDVPGTRVTRVVPLACATPPTDLSIGGGF